jgi:hypothetical protein
VLSQIFYYFNDLSLASTALVNWTCKEVVERTTSWGERKRFFRIFHLLVQQGSFDRTTLQRGFPLERFCLERDSTLLPGLSDFLPLSIPVIKLQDRQLHVVVGIFGSNWSPGYIPCYSYFIYEIDLEIPYPHLLKPKVHFRFDSQTKSISRSDCRDPGFIVEQGLSWTTDTTQVVFQGILGNWLVVWDTDNPVGPPDGFLLPSNSHPEFVNEPFEKCTLRFLNQETLRPAFCCDFYNSPETPLPPFESRDVYIQDKFCIVFSPNCSIIKMDGRTIRIDQKIMRPLHGLMNMTNFSYCTKPDGQIEISLEGETINERICMKHAVDPFEPISMKVLPAPDLPKPPGPPSGLFKVLKWADFTLYFLEMLKWGHTLLRKALAR